MSRFRFIEHTVRAAYSRGSLGAVEPGHESELRMSVKQYIPLSNPGPSPGDVTLIGTHANAFPKETYEPFHDDLYDELKAMGRQIRSIWIADNVHQSKSGIFNEKILGNDPSWYDHARDLLFLINQYQDDMPQPIIGIGHSLGATQLAHMTLFHPRLLQGLVLIDPVIQAADLSTAYATGTTYKKDLWPSRAQAAEQFRSSKAYKDWDSRALDKFVEYGLRDLPTELYPDRGDSDETPVTLTTTKAQDLFTIIRAAYDDDILSHDDFEVKTTKGPGYKDSFPFYRPEPPQLFNRLGELRPSVLWVFGKTSNWSTEEWRKKKVEATGVGPEGNGGVAAGRVQEVVLDCGHLAPMERPGECAKAVASFVHQELTRWMERTDEFRRKWNEVPRREKIAVTDKWRKHIGGQKPAQPKNGTKL